MKIHGKRIEGPAEEVVVIPRNTGDIVFKAKAILDFSDFDKLCPLPEPPQVIRPGGIKSFDPTDRKYMETFDKWATNKTNWMILKSLEATEELEFETVVISDPNTWGNFRDELTTAGFSMVEQAKIINIVTTVNGLNEAKIEEATKRFLATQGAMQENVVSLSSEQNYMQSGELAKG